MSYSALRSADTMVKKEYTRVESSHANFSIHPHGYDFQAVVIPSNKFIWSLVSDRTCCLDTVLCCGFYLEPSSLQLWPSASSILLSWPSLRLDTTCLRNHIASTSLWYNSKFKLFLQNFMKKEHDFKVKIS